ncbi:MAG: glycosyltransferase family 39 protein [Candidatus Yanofskybacteria bacterium]|nr:glycosyltransferase family 39 protein [Candidatus Yanofskybacteria bacterium]
MNKFLPIAIITVAVVLMLLSMVNDSFIVDEIPHVGAGYSYVTKGDMRLNPEHPPLAKDLTGFALLALNLRQDAFQTAFWTTDINGQWEFGRRLIYNSGNNAEDITYVARLPMLLFFVLSAALLFRWANELYGRKGALIALFLFAFSPTVMAHARFVTTDVPALFAVLWSTYFFVRYLKSPTRANFFKAAVIFGVALLTKFSTFLIVPFLGLTALLYGLIFEVHGKRVMGAIKWGFKSVAVFAVGFILVVWPVYYLHTMNYPPERQQNDTEVLLSSFGNRIAADPVVWMADKPVIRAAGQYFLGLLMVTQRSAGGNTIFFLGQVKNYGGPIYFPLVYLIKEPLAWWALAFIAIIVLTLRTRSLPDRSWLKKHFQELAMVIWLAVYWGTSIQSKLNIGVRHLMPVFPFMIMLVSGQIAHALENTKISRSGQRKAIPILVGVLLAWFAVENLRVFPYYLSYFNQLAGGPSGGYRYVVDSNLDWGQDLKRLSQFVDDNNITRIELDYFGWADPSFYLKQKHVWTTSTKYRNGQDFIQRNSSNGWIAVSATFLQGSIGTEEKPESVNYTWLKSYKPVEVIGNSIFVWHITR